MLGPMGLDHRSKRRSSNIFLDSCEVLSTAGRGWDMVDEGLLCCIPFIVEADS